MNHRPGRSRRDVAHEDRPWRSPVRLPELEAVDAVVGPEEERRTEDDGPGPEGHRRTGVDVPQENGPGRRPVGGPRLESVRAVVGPEDDTVPQAGDGIRRGVPGRIDVLEERRAVSGAVRSPELGPVGRIGAGEDEGASELDAGRRPRRHRPDGDRPRDGPVRLPKGGRGAVTHGKKELPVQYAERRDLARRGTGSEVAKQEGPVGRAVGAPRLRSVHAVVRSEQQELPEEAEGRGVCALPGLNVLDEDRARVGPVRPVDLVSRCGRPGREEDRRRRDEERTREGIARTGIDVLDEVASLRAFRRSSRAPGRALRPRPRREACRSRR